MVDRIKFVQAQEFRLSIGANAAATSIRIKLFKDIDNSTLTMTDFGDVGYGTLEPNTSKEEQISFTGITDNGDDTYTLTGVKNVLAQAPYTETSGLSKTHAGGSVFVISNNPGLYNTFANKKNDETIEGVWTFDVTTATQAPVVDDNTYVQSDDAELIHKKFADDTYVNVTGDTMSGVLDMDGNQIDMGSAKIVNVTDPTGAQDAATKAYVDGVAIAGVSDADETTKGVVEEATLAELKAGTATGGTSAKLFITPAKLKSVGGLGIISPNAGATINGATLPVPVYQNKTDNEVYACDANDTAAMKFIGFAITNSTDGNSIDVQISGVVSGFTGLAEGEKYYVQDTAGTIGTSPGTYEILVGIAISTTELVIQKGRRHASGTASFSSTTTSAVTVGFRPSRIRVFATQAAGTAGGGSMSSSWGGWDVVGSNACSYCGTDAGSDSQANVNTSNAWYLIDNGGVNVGNNGTITTITDTGFTLDNTNTAGTARIYWEAEGEL